MVFLFASTFALIQLNQRKRKQWMMVGEGRGVVFGLAAFTLTVIKSVFLRDDETQLSECGMTFADLRHLFGLQEHAFDFWLSMLRSRQPSSILSQSTLILDSTRVECYGQRRAKACCALAEQKGHNGVWPTCLCFYQRAAGVLQYCDWRRWAVF